MTIDLSTAIAAGSLIFAAGGAWITLSSTARRGRDQGKRIGTLEIEVGEMRGILDVLVQGRPPRRASRPLGIPITTPPAGDDD